MKFASLAAILVTVCIGGCEGLGRAVVGPLPGPEPGILPSVCEVDACDAYVVPEPELWLPPADPTAEAACAEVSQHSFRGDEALEANSRIASLLTQPRVGEGPLELRCADILIEVPDTARAFELDLRNISLFGVRMLITTELPARVLVGTSGTVSASDFTMFGPIELVADRALVWGAQISFERGLQQSPAGSLFALESQFLHLALLGEGTVSLRRSPLRESYVEASQLTSELSAWSNILVRAETVEVFEPRIFEGHIEADHFIAAAGIIGYSEFVNCVEVILADVRVADTTFGPTEVPVRLSEASIRNSYIEADLVGSAVILQSAILSPRVDLEGGVIAGSAFCGVELLAIETGRVQCIRCDGGAPPDVCTSSHEEPACPGFATAPCSRGERYSTIPDPMGI